MRADIAGLTAKQIEAREMVTQARLNVLLAFGGVRSMVKDGELTVAQAAEALGISVTTLYTRFAELELLLTTREEATR